MRDISFRAWDKKNKRMFYAGSLSGISDFYLTHHASGKYEDEELYNCFSTVFYDWMQYTGVQDRNGKEIFEGDIIKFDIFPTVPIGEAVKIPFKSVTDAVKFSNGSYKLEYRLELLSTRVFGVGSVEVIGNIYENPELWEVDE